MSGVLDEADSEPGYDCPSASGQSALSEGAPAGEGVVAALDQDQSDQQRAAGKALSPERCAEAGDPAYEEAQREETNDYTEDAPAPSAKRDASDEACCDCIEKNSVEAERRGAARLE